MSKPKTVEGYPAGQLEKVRAACLSLASVLGDLLGDIVVVGGLVPSLLIDAEGAERHVGTLDVDLGLEVALLDSGRYHTLAERLRGGGFSPDRNEEGNVTRQRWRHTASGATVDFLMPPVTAAAAAAAGTLQNLEGDLAAVVTPGLLLAFRDRQQVRVSGRTLGDEAITRDIPVCGVGAFVVLKALAFRNRGENKDAYDLWYVLSHFGAAVEDVAARLRPLLDDANAQQAVQVLREDFATLDSIGPTRAAAFLLRERDDAFRADVAGLVGRLLRSLE